MFFQIYFIICIVLDEVILVKLVSWKFMHDTFGVSEIFVNGYLLSLGVCAYGLDLFDTVFGSIIVNIKAIEPK